VAAAVVLVIAAAVFWFIQRGQAPPEVQAAAVTAGPLVADWSATGYVEARTAQLSAPQAGRVIGIFAEEGQQVAAGQVLARLADAEERAGAQAQAEGARAARAEAAAAAAAVRESDRVLADRVRQAEAEVQAARSRLSQARASLSRSRSVSTANLAAARSRAEAARHQLADLEQGYRPQEIQQAEAAVADAEAVAARARTEQRRQMMLLREGAVGRRAVEDANEALARAEAAVTRARANLDLMRRGYRPQEIAAARSRSQAATEEVRAAEAQVEGLEADERQVDEMAALARAAEAGLAEARSARARVETLRRQQQAAQARAGQAAASLQQAQAGLVERVLTAPFAGTVGRRFVDPGALAVPGQPVLTVVESGRAWVEAEVDEQDLAPVRVGQSVRVTAPAYPGRSFAGRIERIGTQAVPQISETRTSARIVRVRVSLDPAPAADRELLRPGMEVDVAGSATLADRAVQVPNDAILASTEGAYVLLVEGDRIVRRPVRTGFTTGRMTEVLSGLREGERVVVSGKEGLTEGTRVTVRDAS
jgi:RND family efflux transporter MFP subunit